MVQGAQPNATGFVAFAIESDSGIAEAAPQKVADNKANGYVVLKGDLSPVSKKAPKFNEPAGMAFPAFPTPAPESFEIPLVMYPILKGNGLGPQITAMLGDDTLTELVASYAYQHAITWKDLIKTLTYFCHYGANDDDQYRMCAMDSCDIKGKSSDNSLEISLKAQGANLTKLSNGAVETDEFIDPELASQLTHAGMLAEIGQPGAAIRDVIEDFTATLKRNLGFGALMKPGQHPAGCSSHNTVNSKKSNCELKITAQDTDREEILRAMYPVNTEPGTVVQFSDVIRYIKARVSWYGQALATGINGEADYNNAGATAFTFSGSLSGTDVIVGEGQMSEMVYETALTGDKDLAIRLKDPAATYTVSTGSTLGVAVVSKDITVTLATGGSTAAAVLAKLLESTAACALADFGLAPGSSGAGTITDAQAKIDATDCVDGFRFRYTTGAGWGAWSTWRKVTESAQDLVGGITVEMDDDGLTEEGDMFRFCSHYRDMLRLVLPVLAYKDVPKTTIKDGKRMIDIELAAVDTNVEADRPSIVMICNEPYAFDA